MQSIYTEQNVASSANSTPLSTLSAFHALRSRPIPALEDDLPYGISYLSAPCGAGKSYAVESFIVENIGSYPKRFTYVGPTTDRLDECESGLLRKGLRASQIKKIHGDNSSSVTADVMAYLKSPVDGCVLLITHESFTRLPFFPDRKNTQIFIDELIAIDKFFDFNLTVSAKTIRPYLDATVIGNGLVKVTVRHGMNIDDLRDNPDTAFDKFQQFFNHLASANYHVYTWASSFDRVFNAPVVPTTEMADNKYWAIQFLSILKASIFENCCIIGAGFEQSMMCDHFKKHHYSVRAAKVLQERLRTDDAVLELNKRTTIYYGMEGRYYKATRKALTTSGKTVREELPEVFAEHLKDDPFLIQVNNDDKGNPLLKLNGAVRLPGRSHGMNKYQHHTNVVFLASLQRKSTHENLLKALGYCPNAIQQSTLIDGAYQAILRGDTRNKKSVKHNRIYVPDRFLADAIGARMGVTNIVRLGAIEIAEQPTKLKVSKAAIKKKLKVLQSFGAWEKWEGNLTPQNDFPSIAIREKYTNYGVTFEGIDTESCINLLKVTTQENHFAKAESDFEIGAYNLQDFVKWLRNLSQYPRAEDEPWRHFTMTTFKMSEGQDGLRRMANFYRSYGIIIDIDGGALPVERFNELFWEKAGPLQKHSYIICNSYSRNQNAPNRYHAIFPFLYPCIAVEEYEMIYEMLKKRLTDAGYDLKAIKFDEGFAQANHTAMLPCANPKHPDWQFFDTFGMKTREFEQYAIDPRMYSLLQFATHDQPDLIQHRRTEKNRSPEFLVEMERREQQIRSMTEGRRYLFFCHAAKLWHNGYSIHEVYDAQLILAGNERGMRDKAYDNVITLCKYANIKNRPKKRV